MIDSSEELRREMEALAAWHHNHYEPFHERCEAVIREAVGLLFGREARVLTFRELLELPQGAVVWEEYVQDDGECGHLTPAVIPKPGILTTWFDQETKIDGKLLKRNPGGWQMRYWSEKPTWEQRRETAWDA